MRRFVALTCAVLLLFGSFGPPIGSDVAIARAHALNTTSHSVALKGGASITLAVGSTAYLNTQGASSGDVSWRSSDTGIATVDDRGAIRAKQPGIAVISARDTASNRTAVYTVKTYRKRTQRQARSAILSLKKRYRPGRRWTNDNYYYWQASNSHCYGCIAFVGIASDEAFGRFAPLKRHRRFSRIKVGDHVRIGGSHSAIVLRKRKGSIIVAEGNYNDTFRWGRKITHAELKRMGFYVETRY